MGPSLGTTVPRTHRPKMLNSHSRCNSLGMARNISFSMSQVQWKAPSHVTAALLLHGGWGWAQQKFKGTLTISFLHIAYNRWPLFTDPEISQQPLNSKIKISFEFFALKISFNQHFVGASITQLLWAGSVPFVRILLHIKDYNVSQMWIGTFTSQVSQGGVHVVQ